MILLTALVNACGGKGSLASTSSDRSDLGGDGLPVQIENRPIPHQPHGNAGVLSLRPNGCWAADLGEGELLVIFPVGFHKPPEDGSVIRSPDGTTFSDGTAFEATGDVVPVELLPGVPDGFLGGYLAFCDSKARHVAVLDSLRAVDDTTGGVAIPSVLHERDRPGTSRPAWASNTA